MRTLVRAPEFSLADRDVDEALEIAARFVAAGARTAAIADALSAGGAAVRAIREGEASRGATSSAFRARCRRSSRRSPARSTNAARRRSTAFAGARPRAAPDRASARGRARPHGRADATGEIRARDQDAIVTLRNGALRHSDQAEFAGEFPGIVHDTSATGQTLFVEPLETLETNNRVRALRAQGRARSRAHPGRTQRARGQAAQIRTNVAIYVDLDLALARRRSPTG